jgi:Sulfate permease family
MKKENRLQQQTMNAMASEDPTEVYLTTFEDDNPRVVDHHDGRMAELKQGNQQQQAGKQSQEQQQHEEEEDHNDDDDVDDNEYNNVSVGGDVSCWNCSFSRQIIQGGLQEWFQINKPQITSGIAVALASLPEIISFSFIAGVNPIVGLQSAWIVGLVTSIAGGRPGMVSGTTGAVAVVLTGLVQKFGIGHMFYAIMLAGIIQIIFGLLRLRYVSLFKRNLCFCLLDVCRFSFRWRYFAISSFLIRFSLLVSLVKSFDSWVTVSAFRFVHPWA